MPPVRGLSEPNEKTASRKCKPSQRCWGLSTAVVLAMTIALAGGDATRAEACKAEEIQNWVEELEQGGGGEERARIELIDCETDAIAPLRKKLAVNDWQSNPQKWELQEALLEVLTEIAGDLAEDAPMLEKEKLKSAIARLKDGISVLEKFEEEFQQTPPSVSGNAFDTPEKRTAYAAAQIAKLRPPLRKLQWWLWWQQFGLWVGGGAIAVLGYGSVLWLQPLWLLRLPTKFKIPKTEIELTMGMMRRLTYRPRVLDRWVAIHLTTARQEFEKKDTVRERAVHISIPARLDKELLVEPSGKDLRGICAKPRFCVLIVAEGGSGKTSLACQIALWAMSDDPEERLCKHRMLPILIEQELPVVEEGKDSLLEAIRGQLNDLVRAVSPIQPELVEQLLRQRRLLVVVDHLSEMTKATRDKVRPQQPEFAINALVVTSRLDEKLGGVNRTRLEPLRVEGDRLSSFIAGYLERLGKRDLFEDEDYFSACRRLSRMVGQRNITVLLAKLFVDQMVEQQQGAGGTLPANVPELMLSYLNQLNRTIEPANRRDRLQVQKDAQIVAWECLRQTYRPAPANKEDVSKALRRTGSTTETAQEQLDYLETRLRLLQTLEPGDKLRIILDPLAEYLAALWLVGDCRDGSDDRWRDVLDSVDKVLESTNDAPEAIRGFLLAVRDASLLKKKEARVPDWVPEELARKAGIDPEELRQIEEKRRIRLLISELSAPELDYRIRAAEDLGDRGAAAAIAVPNLLGMVENQEQSVEARKAAATALGKLGANSNALRDQIADRLVALLVDEAEASSAEDDDRLIVKRSAAEALGCMQAARDELIDILENTARPLTVHQGCARALSRFDAESGAQMPVLVVRIQNGQTTTQVRHVRVWKESLPEGLTLDLVDIPGGSFLMGSPPDEAGRDVYQSVFPETEGLDVEAQHKVAIASFKMSRCLITQAQWRTVAALPRIKYDLDPDLPRFKGNDRPVENVNWYEALELCDRLSAHTGRPYRLLSEAEWEYACRARSTTPFHFGETIDVGLVNYDGNYTYGEGIQGEYRQETTEVGMFGVANAFGLSDMHGNLWEWCADHWHPSYEGAPTDGSAWLTEDESSFRLLRGGSWSNLPWYCRSALRYRYNPDVRNGISGFRAACDAPWTG
ncbi:hypothetical protein KR51_00021320 [Rubidibacter lacunae KORDI 51-2]|uniref:Uncharacterized protein n=1 Tax=Rubidibacter lacunae KORDI 51-2 TaxID=582515 RepID=U5DL04_9CHRO|nr:SUMF1/EgtB/PvdO family nonheme iron enzyme [Rubidibacter lacunae]ERN41244.1 hypothetical protein KR51_00021320 [Rubidibacter lacunae KORDI 51-2]